MKERLVLTVFLLFTALLVAVIASGPPASRRYAKVNRVEFDAAVSNGLANPSNMFAKCNEWQAKDLMMSVDSNWFMISCDDTNHIVQLSDTGTVAGITFYLYTYPEFLAEIEGTNWQGGPTNAP